MAKHPLDISSFLGLDPEEITKPKKNPPQQNKQHFQKPKAKAKPEEDDSKTKATETNLNDDKPRIEKQYWQQLNAESRRIFTSRMWKDIDFNPMLSELTDLSKLTEKWLRWAIPTYANGIKEGPIKDWFEGKRDDRDFHYILVGEHLKHLKEVRQKRKEEKEPNLDVVSDSPQEESNEITSEQITTPDQEVKAADQVQVSENTPTQSESEQTSSEAVTELDSENQEDASPGLQMALSELDDHIKWFQHYIDSQNTNEPNQS